MVKIVGGGHKATCNNCGSVLEFTRSDVRAGERQAQSYDDHESVIICPKKNCGRAVNVTKIVGTTSSEVARRQELDDSGY